MKREFLMLAQTYVPVKHFIGGWLMSEKLDGMRCFWDGGITTGMLAKDVPWANVEKDARLVEEVYATGLWSRWGKVVRAPEWWISNLPKNPLDGELWHSRGGYQKLVSIVKSHLSSRWNEVNFKIFDTPKLSEIFSPGYIDTQHYHKVIGGNILGWCLSKLPEGFFQCEKRTFEGRLAWLMSNINPTELISVHQQETLPLDTLSLNTSVDFKLEEVLNLEGEGLVFRRRESAWLPERSRDILKYKPFTDDEGIVIGYNWAEEGKLAGLMGSLVVSWKRKTFKVSGFTDEERRVAMTSGDFQPQAFYKPGQPIPDNVGCPEFPRGTTITFKYRELTDDNIPKEARYYRKRNE
jgi:DNA ligase-1